MRRKQQIEYIAERLTHLRVKVEMLNSLNLTDLNIHAENFFRDFLNLLYGYNLQNINIIKSNAAAIDLGDAKRRIAIQVTSDSSLKKLKKTVAAFEEKNLDADYDRLVVLRIGKTTTHRQARLGKRVNFDCRDDTWDTNTIIKDVTDLRSGALETIVSFLRSETNQAHERPGHSEGYVGPTLPSPACSKLISLEEIVHVIELSGKVSVVAAFLADLTLSIWLRGNGPFELDIRGLFWGIACLVSDFPRVETIAIATIDSEKFPFSIGGPDVGLAVVHYPAALTREVALGKSRVHEYWDQVFVRFTDPSTENSPFLRTFDVVASKI